MKLGNFEFCPQRNRSKNLANQLTSFSGMALFVNFTVYFQIASTDIYEKIIQEFTFTFIFRGLDPTDNKQTVIEYLKKTC